MNIVERLRLYKPIDNTSTLINEAADLIEQQAVRIKELETAYESASTRAAIWQQNYQALRKKIEDAPVIAVFPDASYVLDRPGTYRLIDMEDLK